MKEIWMTRDEYDSLEVKDNDTFYCIVSQGLKDKMKKQKYVKVGSLFYRVKSDSGGCIEVEEPGLTERQVHEEMIRVVLRDDPLAYYWHEKYMNIEQELNKLKNIIYQHTQ